MSADRRTYPRLLAASMLLAAFAAGAASALLYVRAQDRNRPGTMVTMDLKRQLPEEFRRLDMSAGQRERALVILDSTRSSTEELFRTFSPKLQVLLDSADAHIQAVLTPDQRARLAADRARRPRMVLQKETVINGRRTLTVDTTKR